MATQVLTALVLEDEPFIALDIEEMFELAGFDTIQISGSCADALEWLKTETPSVAILDIHLKDGACVEVAAALKARNVPFIVCSGAHPEDAVHSLSSGIWLPKPLSQSALISTLRAALPVTGIWKPPLDQQITAILANLPSRKRDHEKSTDSDRIRYATRETDHGYWSVYDIFSGETVTLNNMPLEILHKDEAGDWANELNRDYRGHGSATRH